MTKTRTYREVFYPGAFFDEPSVSEVTARDPYGFKPPVGAFAFQYFDVKETEEDGVTLKSGRLNVSPMYYYGGRVMTLDEVKREYPERDILIRNMEGNGWGRVVECRTGNFKPFEGDDIWIKE